MPNLASRGKNLLLWGAILLLSGGLLHQMTTPSAPSGAPRASATVQQRTATARPTAKSTSTPKPTSTQNPTAAPKPLALSAAFAGTESHQVKISFSAQCSDTNHVGNSWTQAFYINGEAVRSSKTLSLRAGENLQLQVVITEDDTYPDIGSDLRTITLSEADLTQGTRIATTVDVRENRGRYAGNIAQWTVVYTISPVP